MQTSSKVIYLIISSMGGAEMIKLLAEGVMTFYMVVWAMTISFILPVMTD